MTHTCKYIQRQTDRHRHTHLHIHACMYVYKPKPIIKVVANILPDYKSSFISLLNDIKITPHITTVDTAVFKLIMANTVTLLTLAVTHTVTHPKLQKW